VANSERERVTRQPSRLVSVVGPELGPPSASGKVPEAGSDPRYLALRGSPARLARRCRRTERRRRMVQVAQAVEQELDSAVPPSAEQAPPMKIRPVAECNPNPHSARLEDSSLRWALSDVHRTRHAWLLVLAAPASQ
jgi:hypothetical protein